MVILLQNIAKTSKRLTLADGNSMVFPRHKWVRLDDSLISSADIQQAISKKSLVYREQREPRVQEQTVEKQFVVDKVTRVTEVPITLEEPVVPLESFIDKPFTLPVRESDDPASLFGGSGAESVKATKKRRSR